MSNSTTDNTRAGAQFLDVSSRDRIVRDSLSRQDPVDYFRIRFASSGSLSISLKGLKADTDLQLLNARGKVIAASQQPGTLPETIDQPSLAAGTYYIRVSRIRGNTNYRLFVSADVGSDTRNLWGTYEGSATTSIDVSDLFGNFVGTSKTKLDTRITIGDVARQGTDAETNPFNLVITTLGGQKRQEGAIELYSAAPFSIRGGFVAQYWTLQLKGDRLTGTLTNSFTADDLSGNLFISRQQTSSGTYQLATYDVAQGSQLSGTITDQEIRLRIDGNSTDFTRPFTTEIVVERS
jgi:hypothetical protein